MSKHPKERNKPKEVKISKNPIMNAYQEMRQNEGGTVTFNYEREFFNPKTKKTYKKVVGKQVVKLDKIAIEKRSISEFLGLLNSMQHDFGANSYTF